MNKAIKSIIPLLTFLATAAGGFSQSSDSLKRTPNNTIEFLTSFHEFFDGNPMIQTHHTDREGWLNLAKGIGYLRRLGQKNAVGASARYFGTTYYSDDLSEKPLGETFVRMQYLFELVYYRELLSDPKASLSALAGINFRHGYEWYVVGYSSHVNVETYDLRDGGVTVGARGAYMLPWNFQLSTEVKYTRYMFTHAKTVPAYAHFTNGPTMNMLTMQLGLGYRF